MLLPVLLASLVVLAGVTIVTRRPAGPVPDLPGYLDRWSAAHDGYDPRPTRLLRGWLTVVHRTAAPLARAGVLPDVLTAWTIVLAAVVVVLAALGGAWAFAGGLLLALAGIGDALDGAVAVLTDRATRWGYVLDSVADRVTDTLFLVAAWVVGASPALVVVTGVGVFLLEYLRARAGNAGGDPAARITVGERPSRIICCAIAVGLAGLVPDLATPIATVSVAILLVLTVIALGQLAVAVRRDLR